MRKLGDHSLYLVISEEYSPARGALEIARLAIAGGVDIIQMREKDKAREELLELGKSLALLCKESSVTFIVNDDPLLAREIGADGVHLGQEDIKRFSIPDARRILGKSKIIGLSTHSLEQFKAANETDVDYAAFGPIFYTRTKDYFIGTSDIKNVLRISAKPVFFIGGINLSNINDILKEGAINIALMRGISEAPDIASRAAALKAEVEKNSISRKARKCESAKCDVRIEVRGGK